MVQHLQAALDWLQPNALLFALILPPVIRMVGHWLPEELFMIAMGVLASRADSPGAAAALLGAVLASHFVTDQVVYLGGRWLRPRLDRFPRVGHRLRQVTRRLADSRGALLGLIPARVLPLGRGAWLAGAGVVGVPWPRFATVDVAALVAHLLLWCGLGWWLAGDLLRLAVSVEVVKVGALWTVAAMASALLVVALWRRASWRVSTSHAATPTDDDDT